MVSVLFLHRDLPFHGGVANTFLDFARHRDRSRVDMRVASFVAPSAPMMEAFTAARVPVHVIGDGGYAGPTWRLRQLLGRHRIGVVLCGSLKAFMSAKAAALGLPCRPIFRIASIPLVIAGPLKRRLYRAVAVHDTMVYNSRAVAETHAFPGHRGRSLVIYNGVSDPSSDEEARPYPRHRRHEFGLPPDAVVLGYTAEFIGWKDHDTLLAAFAALAAERPDLHLVLLGAGERLEPLRRSVASVPMRERLHFLGPRTDARRVLGLMDVYAHPARGEGFGRAIVEAMLAELPVVAADTGSLPEIVTHGETGLLFRAGDPHDLARQLRELLEDGGLRARLGASARASCLERFSPQGFAEAYTAVFEQELGLR
jgi:glycosyltransferase involved in cell wall biosynthesis